MNIYERQPGDSIWIVKYKMSNTKFASKQVFGKDKSDALERFRRIHNYDGKYVVESISKK